MKKILWGGLIVILLAAVIGYWRVNETRPSGVAGPKAEKLADKMLAAVNYAGWDTLTAVKWTFRGQHHYIWDKKRNFVEVRWDENRVLLDPSSLKGLAYTAGELLGKSRDTELVNTAWEYFANDSFWLAAPFKARDPGTRRSVVTGEYGEALFVEYTSGGVTPGDGYLWILDDDGLPIRWKMWVKIIPIGGMEFTWESWSEYTNQVKLSSKRQGILPLEITGIETSNQLEDLYPGEDPFKALEAELKKE